MCAESAEITERLVQTAHHHGPNNLLADYCHVTRDKMNNVPDLGTLIPLIVSRETFASGPLASPAPPTLPLPSKGSGSVEPAQEMGVRSGAVRKNPTGIQPTSEYGGRNEARSIIPGRLAYGVLHATSIAVWLPRRATVR